jgi:hypothetical protein
MKKKKKKEGDLSLVYVSEVFNPEWFEARRQRQAENRRRQRDNTKEANAKKLKEADENRRKFFDAIKLLPKDEQHKVISQYKEGGPRTRRRIVAKYSRRIYD